MPIIWKLEDTNGDGRADKRTKWFDGKTANGCANDLHGPYLGPDGFIYWCKGAFERQQHKRPRGQIIDDRAAHIYRMRPDGTELDSIMAGGMDNPVGMAFSETGEVFSRRRFTATRAAAIATRWYTRCMAGCTRRTGVSSTSLRARATSCRHSRTSARRRRVGWRCMRARCSARASRAIFYVPVQHAQGAAARAHAQRCHLHLARQRFPRVRQSRLSPYRRFEDADGSLLVVDTGGWYKLCCPTSQIAKPEVLGGIYRIRRTGAKPLKIRVV